MSLSEGSVFEYKAEREIVDRVFSLIKDVKNRGLEPTGLLLGYGTYISLCLAVSVLKHSRGVIQLSQFADLPIVIDRSYEYRVDVRLETTAWEEAVSAALAQANY